MCQSDMSSPAANPPSPEAALRVLLVDDHADMLTMLDLLMQRRAYAVRTATSGYEALEMAPEFAPHVVVSDIGMPGMDGFQFMENLRATSEQRPFKSIALTGYDFVAEPARALEAGYDAQLTKPIEFDILFQMIEDLAGAMDEKS